MKIIKKINNSAAIGLDSKGNEVVVIGKGIGFPQIPYEITDLSLIEKTFYGIDSSNIGALDNIPNTILLASDEIVEQARIELNSSLNPNLPVTLADHLNFAIERLKKGYDLATPIAYDVAHFYPKEYAMAKKALSILYDSTDIMLPDCEAVNIALHFLNAESERDNMKDAAQIAKVLEDVTVIIERYYSIKLDKESYNYSRFATHVRYLVQRLQSGEEMAMKNNEALYNSLIKEQPVLSACAEKISTYLQHTWGWTCSKDELLYLMLHINRIAE